MKHPFQRVEVTWVDSRGETGWTDYEEAVTTRDLRCVSVGYLIGETKDRVILTAGLSFNHIGKDTGVTQCDGQMIIPKSAIRKRKVLR